MLKHLNGLLYLQYKRRKQVLDYDKTEWYFGIKRFLSLSPFFSLSIFDANQRC